MSGDLTLFYLFAALAVGASLLVIGQRHPMYSVLLLIASFGALAGLYVLLDAPFAAAIQIVVYAGAIMVLFLFVVMLLNVPREEPVDREQTPDLYRARWFGAALAGVLLVELGWVLARAAASGTGTPVRVEDVSSVRLIGRVLFREYAFAFELTSVLIVVAMIGAVLLARRADGSAGE